MLISLLFKVPSSQKDSNFFRQSYCLFWLNYNIFIHVVKLDVSGKAQDWLSEIVKITLEGWEKVFKFSCTVFYLVFILHSNGKRESI